jgi:uncharacterized protein with PQ loop repeat
VKVNVRLFLFLAFNRSPFMIYGIYMDAAYVRRIQNLLCILFLLRYIDIFTNLPKCIYNNIMMLQ